TRRRQSFHRSLSRYEELRLVDAALGLAEYRQGVGRTPYLNSKESVEIVGTPRTRSGLLHPGNAGIRGLLERPEVGATLRDEEPRDHDGASVEGLQQDVQSSPAVSA